jgi:hypothetical protein
MATIINADTSNGLKLTSDTSGDLELQSGGTTKAKITSSGLQNASGSAITSQAGKNKIINGDMRIDQRNGGASNTLVGTSTSHSTSAMMTDRWQLFLHGITNAQTYQQVTDAPAGFSHSLKITNNSTTQSVGAGNALTPRQKIEGLNTAHLNWGTSDAKTITISFWVKASVTGTYPVSISNNAFDRAYVSTYTVSSANTWEKKTVTIAGDTSGTWLTSNSLGINVMFGLDAGTNFDTTANEWVAGSKRSISSNVHFVANASATWQITGVQLEEGTSATPFEHLQYGQQMQLCQRYFYSIGGTAAYEFMTHGMYVGTTNPLLRAELPVKMRAAPSLGSTGTFLAKAGNSNLACASFSVDQSATQTFSFSATISGGTSTIGYATLMFANNSTATRLTFSAEL